jgi:hypothetical protein
MSPTVISIVADVVALASAFAFISWWTRGSDRATRWRRILLFDVVGGVVALTLLHWMEWL